VTRDGGREERAIRLMPDDAHGAGHVLEHTSEVRLGGAGSKPVVDAYLRAGRLRHCVGRLPRPEQRAREDELRRLRVPGELLAEGSGFVPATRGEGTQRVGISLLSVRVPDEEDEHRASIVAVYCSDVASLRYVIVDVFTDRPLEGNQLAVFTDARDLDDETMQALALEMGHSETTFVLPAEEGGTARMRIFTPRSELPFAGHPTLGTAWVLGAPLQRTVVELETKAGIVPVELERDESGALAFGRMEQPLPTVESYAGADALLRALRVEGSRLPVETYDNGVRFTYVTLASPDEVASLRPDFSALEALGVAACCMAGSDASWKTRMFAPGFGIPEDPATGAAAGPLACHVCRHGLAEWGTWIEISQGTEIGRPSTLFALAEGGDAGIERVACGGRAVVVARGEFRLPQS
jgi:trans-2,3-dihydro-3-hydroxyanthranilate isomerase